MGAYVCQSTAMVCACVWYVYVCVVCGNACMTYVDGCVQRCMRVWYMFV